MKEKQKVICILNPLSGDGASYKKWPDVERIFKELNIQYELILHRGDLSEKIQELLELYKTDSVTFAGIGGDGTHHALINGIMRFQEKNTDAHIPDYAIIPLGTGNNIAKSFGMGSLENLMFNDLRRAVIATVYGADFKLDVGKIGLSYFIDAFTAGIDAQILAGRNRDKSTMEENEFLYNLLKGYPLYIFNTLKSFNSCKPIHGEIEVDGEKWYSGELFNVIINNTRIYAGEFDLTDSALANDGMLDLLLFTGHADYLQRYLLSHRYLPRKIRSLASANQKFIRQIKGKRFSIRLGKITPAQLDGEEIPASNEFILEVIPEALTIKVPVEPA